MEINVNDSKYDMNNYIPNESIAQLFIQNSVCNTTGTLREANATDMAIIKMLDKFGYDVEEERKKYLPGDFTRFQFTSKRKKMSTVLENIEDNEHGYDKRLMTKGASEIVLGNCSHYLDENGEKQELTDEIKDDLKTNVIEKMAREALRTLCLAYKDLEEGEGGDKHDDDHEDGENRVVEKENLTCIAIIGIRDVIRPEVPDAVGTCQNAGITVRMVTGDNIITAEAIAKECGILPKDFEITDDYEITTGKEFNERVGGIMNPGAGDEEVVSNLSEFKKYRANLKVLARSRPEDKYLLATGLKQMKDVVAVTGDGTNDAPALKKADVGFAMGITGTDVAQHAADIVILDDSFASIVSACMWGRNIYDNIRRFLQF